ncbi:MAG: glycosyltransferase family 2 protein, partial [Cytophagia bacterium]|nr:glycosyltransferase family 2 protein [Cytophagia bacterium]
MMKLSVVIITLNEEKNIRRCLESVKTVADEIVVVDSLSTDKTEEICGEYNVRFIKEKFRGYVEQVNYAMELATNNFVLAIDADEELSAELIEAVQAVKKNKTADAYEMNRLSSYCGKFIYHGTWHPDIKIRLWDRTKGKWGGEN